MQNQHWQTLIAAQKSGVCINLHQKNGDPLINVQVISLEDGVLLKNDVGDTLTIELSEISGVEILEIVDDFSEEHRTMTSIGKLLYYQDRIQFIKLARCVPRGADNYLVKRVVSVDDMRHKLSFIDDFGKRHRVSISNIKEIHVRVGMSLV